VLVEHWTEQSTLFSPIPRDVAQLEAYEFEMSGRDRIAGRDAVVIDIRPVDGLRFARRLWLDEQLAFPLRAQSMTASGDIIGEIKFADISFDANIDDAELASRYALDDFRWYPVERREAADEPSDWRSGDLPDGFAEKFKRVERLRNKEKPVTHIVYSDGLSSVSVFIEADAGTETTTRTRMGNSSSFSTRLGDHRVTVVGEVPPETVEQIALSMRR
jgi:sigma-E factor negative regulatory protein RseB